MESVSLFQQHLLYKLISPHMRYLCTNKIHILRITKGNIIELAPSAYFSIINVCLMDINVFAKFDEIPSLPFQNIKENPKHHRRKKQMDG